MERTRLFRSLTTFLPPPRLCVRVVPSQWLSAAPWNPNYSCGNELEASAPSRKESYTCAICTVLSRLARPHAAMEDLGILLGVLPFAPFSCFLSAQFPAVTRRVRSVFSDTVDQRKKEGGKKKRTLLSSCNQTVYGNSRSPPPFK